MGREKPSIIKTKFALTGFETRISAILRTVLTRLWELKEILENFRFFYAKIKGTMCIQFIKKKDLQ